MPLFYSAHHECSSSGGKCSNREFRPCWVSGSSKQIRRAPLCPPRVYHSSAMPALLGLKQHPHQLGSTCSWSTPHLLAPRLSSWDVAAPPQQPSCLPPTDCLGAEVTGFCGDIWLLMCCDLNPGDLDYTASLTVSEDSLYF